MKKLFFSVLLMALMASCTSANKQQQVVVGQDSIRKVNPEFFYMVTDTLKKGANTWNRSKVFFGDGYHWIDIVANNKFLQKPGMVWQDSITKIWYAMVRPGDVLNIAYVMPAITFIDTIHPQTTQLVNPVPVKSKSFIDFILGMPWWGWLIILLGVIFLFIGIIGSINEESKKKKAFKYSEDPTKEGKPFVDGGVKPENAEEHFLNLLQNSNPGSKITLKNVKNGFISTPDELPSIVKFVDGTKQNLTFRNVPGHEGEVSIDEKPFTKEYFFDDCGNPVYNRRSMKSGIIFTQTPINFGNGSQASESSAVKEVVETLKAEITETEQVVKVQIPPTVNLGSEAHQQKMLILDIAKTLAVREDIHELTIDDNNEALGLQVKFKFNPAEKKALEKSADDKK